MSRESGARGSVPRGLTLAGAALVLVVGLIHLIESPDYFKAAAYIGVLFIANAAGAAVAAFGMFRGAIWGWGLAFLISVGAMIAYVVSRTTGLPGAVELSQEPFLEPSGLLALVVEALFVVLCAAWLAGMGRASARS